MNVLWQNDKAYMKKDPMVLICLSMPILMLIFYKVILIRIEILGPYLKYMEYIFIGMTALSSGMGIGFRILDDKDEHMLKFYAVSPIGLNGYFKYRTVCSMGFTLIGISLLLIGMNSFGGKSLWIILQSLLLAPFAMGSLAMLCKNKIQGLTCMKLISIILFVPFIRLLGDSPYHKLLYLLPNDSLYCFIVEGSIPISGYIVNIILVLSILYWLFKIKVRSLL